MRVLNQIERRFHDWRPMLGASTTPSPLLDDAYVSPMRPRRLRRCYSIVAFLCTSATLASSVYAIFCGSQLQGRSDNPELVNPSLLIGFGLVGVASTMITSVYAINTATYRP